MKKKKEYTLCRACGEEIEINGTVLCCRECGAKQLYPQTPDEETKQHYTDAYRYMLHDDFYSALRLFEAIAKTDDSPAASMGIFMSSYGVGADREHITGNILHSCKRRNTADPCKDEAFLHALSLANANEKVAINEICDFICAEQRRLEREEREAVEREKNSLTEDGLSTEYDDARKKAEEKARKDREETERIVREAREAEEKRSAEREKRIAKAKKRERSAKLLKILIPTVAVICAVICICVFAVMPAIKYSSAVESYESGDYASAAAAFRELGDYKRSAEYLGTIPFYGLNAGEEVQFGEYYCENGAVKSDIDWIVLEADDNSVLLISKYVLEVKKYNEAHISVTWETCDLRAFLNGEFYNGAFSPVEQKRIMEVTLENPDNSSQGTIGGNSTVDRVFALSCEEAEKYLVGKDYSYGVPTRYVKNLGVYEDEEGGTGRCWYWLRSPGSSQSNAAKIEYDGSVSYRGSMIHYSKYGVRPAIRVAVEKIGELID